MNLMSLSNYTYYLDKLSPNYVPRFQPWTMDSTPWETNIKTTITHGFNRGKKN